MVYVHFCSAALMQLTTGVVQNYTQCISTENIINLGDESIFSKVKITSEQIYWVLTNEIISILVNSLIFVIFTLFEETELIPRT